MDFKRTRSGNKKRVEHKWRFQIKDFNLLNCLKCSRMVKINTIGNRREGSIQTLLSECLLSYGIN